jgi:hypothetical protein
MKTLKLKKTFMKTSLTIVTTLFISMLVGISCADGKPVVGEEPETPEVCPDPSPVTRGDSITLKVGIDYGLTTAPLSRTSGKMTCMQFKYETKRMMSYMQKDYLTTLH